MAQDMPTPPKEKTIAISISYEEEGGGIKHNLKHKITTFKTVAEVLDGVRSLEQTLTGKLPLF